MLRCPIDNLPCTETGCSFRGDINERCSMLSEEKKNTMENFTKEDLSDAFNAGATRMYHDLNLGNGNPPEFEQWFEKFSILKNHPTTASGSVAAPNPDKELIADNPATYTHFDMLTMVARQTKHMFEENEQLREVLKELLPIAQNHASTLRWDEEHAGDEVGGKEAQAIIERARKLLNE